MCKCQSDIIMKKIPAVSVIKKAVGCILCFVFIFCVAGCKNSDNEKEKMQIPNPVSEISVDDMAKELGLKEINIDGLERTTKITGNSILYSIDVKSDETVYNIRLLKDDTYKENDISGVYLSKKCISTIFDSATNDEPSVSVESDSEYSKAYGYFNGYHFSVSTHKKLTAEDMHKTTLSYIKLLISKSNLS